MEGVALFISLLFFGFITGCLVGLFGGGGGFYFVPVLSLVFQVQPQVAVATSLAAIIPTTISAGISHFRQGNLDLGVGIVFGAGGLIGAWIGAYASSLVSASRLQKAFGVFMLLMALQMCLSAGKRMRDTHRPGRVQVRMSGLKILLGLFLGLLSGAMAGLFGLSGTPPVIAGLYVLNLPVKMVVGTSVFVLFFNAVSGLAGHLLLGQFDWTLAFFLSLGAGAGALWGPIWLGRVRASTLERVYGPVFILLILVFGVMMILR
jgi:uncharacterized membrane protein YfcA